MKIVSINTYNNFSTGKIMFELSDYYFSCSHNTYCLYGRRKNNEKGIYFGIFPLFNKFIDFIVALTGKVGHFHIYETNRLIKKLDEIKPDVIHLHNIHGNYLNFKMLMKYIAKHHINVIITAHDFYLATGRCAYAYECTRWKDGCGKCKYKHQYMKTLFFDCSAILLKEKVYWLNQIKPTIVCPSIWLKNEFMLSKISNLDFQVIRNGIDTNIFKYIKTERSTKVRLLGVAYPWNERKGLNVFNLLAKTLDPSKYEIALVGLTPKDVTHPNIIRYGVKKDNDLASLYRSADIFINPTYSDNFPTTNIESLCSGTPVFAFDVGGACEVINDHNGKKIKVGDIKTLLSFIYSYNRNDYNNEAISNESIDLYSKKKMCEQYLDLIERKHE